MSETSLKNVKEKVSYSIVTFAIYPVMPISEMGMGVDPGAEMVKMP
jgi:hypothetical protein